VPVTEIAVADALAREPALHAGIRRAFLVGDASMDAWKLAWTCARSAQDHGARILTYQRVTEVLRQGDAVAGVVVVDTRTGEEQVDRMLDEGEKLVPGFRQARALRVWAGARPLFGARAPGDDDTRDITRAHALIDHRERDGITGFVTITGGKATTFRLMAEETVDLVGRLVDPS